MNERPILKKLLAIMNDVSYIQKDAKNPAQGYTYASERAIKDALHDAFVKHGILFTLSINNPRAVTEKIMAVDAKYTFHDVESGDSLTGEFVGTGHAREEKGTYAAITGAIKYILTSNFLIPTGDDPENDGQSGTNSKKTEVKKPSPIDERKAALAYIDKHEGEAYPAAKAVLNARNKHLGTENPAEADTEHLKNYAKHIQAKRKEAA